MCVLTVVSVGKRGGFGRKASALLRSVYLFVLGLGAYLAWVHRDWSGNIKTIGLTAAVAAAIVGAWLGFHATGGILALITTIVGAAAGANLILLVLDITRDRSNRSRLGAPPRNGSPDALP